MCGGWNNGHPRIPQHVLAAVRGESLVPCTALPCRQTPPAGESPTVWHRKNPWRGRAIRVNPRPFFTAPRRVCRMVTVPPRLAPPLCRYGSSVPLCAVLIIRASARIACCCVYPVVAVQTTSAASRLAPITSPNAPRATDRQSEAAVSPHQFPSVLWCAETAKPKTLPPPVAIVVAKSENRPHGSSCESARNSHFPAVFF